MAEEVADVRSVALAGLFDDAAVFPPASRPLGEAVTAHRGHQAGERGWLVQRLLIRASQAEELLGLLEPEDAFEVGAILERDSAETFEAAVTRQITDLAAMARDRRLRLTDLEVQLGTDQPDAEVVAVVSALQAARLSDPVQVAFEVSVAGRSAGQVLDGLGPIVTARAGSDPSRVLVAKVRCGGATAVTIPDDEELAGFLLACARQGVPFKATAGLHNLSRTVNEEHGGLEHGVYNLIAASSAAHQGAGLDVIQAHLARPGEEMKLGPGAMITGEDVIEGSVIKAAREAFFLGIGCCEVMDPIAELGRTQVLSPTGGLS